MLTDVTDIVLTSDDRVDVLRAEFVAYKVLMDERDLRYAARFDSTDEKTSLALNASEKAVTKAENATEKRFEGVNEMRGSLNDMTLQLLTKAEANAKFQGIEKTQEEMKKDIVGLREFRSAGTGQKEAVQTGLLQKQFDIRTILAILSMFVAGAAIYFRGH